MSDGTGISWTDATWNPIRGCTRVSEGCRNCYAQTVAHRFSGPGLPYEGLTNAQGRWNGTIRVVEEHLLDPLRWQRPRKVFVNSMSDLFHENVSDETIDRVFAVMALAPRHTFQVLTKRPERMLAYMHGRSLEARWMDACATVLQSWPPLMDRKYCVLAQREPWVPLRNVWLGVSVEDQATADARIPLLLQTPAAVRFVSAEPLLGPVTLLRWMPHPAVYRIHEPSPSGKHQSQCVECGRVTAGMERECRTFEMGQGLDWVIVGGESGPGARSCDVAWIRSLVKQCDAAGVACFVKQLGAAPHDSTPCGGPNELARNVTAHLRDRGYSRLKARKGDDPAEWPEDLRVQEFPGGGAA